MDYYRDREAFCRPSLYSSSCAFDRALLKSCKPFSRSLSIRFEDLVVYKNVLLQTLFGFYFLPWWPFCSLRLLAWRKKLLRPRRLWRMFVFGLEEKGREYACGCFYWRFETASLLQTIRPWELALRPGESSMVPEVWILVVPAPILVVHAPIVAAIS